MLKSNWTGVQKETECIMKIPLGPEFISFILLVVMPPEIMDQKDSPSTDK